MPADPALDKAVQEALDSIRKIGEELKDRLSDKDCTLHPFKIMVTGAVIDGHMLTFGEEDANAAP